MTKLNAQQQAFVDSDACFISLSAGPGTGKSTALTRRIQQDSELPTSGRMVCITFTEAGAESLKSKLADLGVQPWFVGTIHAYALSMLKTFGGVLGYRTEIEVVDDDRVLFMVRELLVSAGLKKAKPADVMKILASPSPAPGVLKTIAQRVIGQMRTKSIATFDTILSEFSLIITQVPPIDWLYMDEAQDFSEMDWKIIFGLCAKRMIAVGDEDQCIYEWRDASPRRLLEFRGEQMQLTHNYRSTASVIHTANKLISHNKLRRAKEIIGARGVVGNPPQLMMHHDGMGLVGLAHNIVRSTLTGSVAVLCRYNKSWGGLITPDIVTRELSSVAGSMGSRKDSEENPNTALHIGTIHSAKGLEYDTVFLIDWTPKEITEEERRLFYVGMTRAKNNLIIWSKEPSQFCKEAGLV